MKVEIDMTSRLEEKMLQQEIEIKDLEFHDRIDAIIKRWMIIEMIPEPSNRFITEIMNFNINRIYSDEVETKAFINNIRKVDSAGYKDSYVFTRFMHLYIYIKANFPERVVTELQSKHIEALKSNSYGTKKASELDRKSVV